jgi:starch phosphorylase
MLGELKENLIHKDWFMTLLDIESYCAVKETALYDYENRAWWKRKSLVNTAKAGFFSSDRTINDYNWDIWHIK